MTKFIFIISFYLMSALSYSQNLRIGLIADCQYCDCDYSERWDNNYRQALPRLKAAVDTLNAKRVQYTFHLGDFIDREYTSYKAVDSAYESLNMPHYHLLGNHDFSVKDSLKSSVLSSLRLKKPYYVVSKQNWTFIVLDGTDISTYKSADRNDVSIADSIRQTYLTKGRTQALPWNGAIGDTQLNWLDTELTKADNSLNNVIILCHFPVLPKGDANLWNDKEVVEILEKHRSVKAYINGHHHPGNYMVQNGIHYLTLQGMVKTRNQTSFADIELQSNQIIVKGYGREKSRVLEF